MSHEVTEAKNLEKQLDGYNISSCRLKIYRSPAEFVWYILQWKLPYRWVFLKKDTEQIQNEALEKARNWFKQRVSRLAPIKPLNVYISPEDLELLQKSENIVFFPNHQKELDITYMVQMLIEQLWEHENTHFIMRVWLPGGKIFEKLWAVVTKRGRDKAEQAKWKKIDTRTRVLDAREELPDFLHKFLQIPNKNMILFPQWGLVHPDKAFRFDDVEKDWLKTNKVVDATLKNIENTSNATHAFVVIRYQNDRVDMEVKVIQDEDKKLDRDGFRDYMNEVFSWVKMKINY